MGRIKYLNVEGDEVPPNGSAYPASASDTPDASNSPSASIPVPANIGVDVNKTPQIKKAYQYALFGTAVGAIYGIVGGKNVFHSALFGLAGGALVGFFLGNNTTVTTPIDSAIAEAQAVLAKGETLSQPLIDKLKTEYNNMVSSVPQGTTPPDVVAKANTVQAIMQANNASQTSQTGATAPTN